MRAFLLLLILSTLTYGQFRWIKNSEPSGGRAGAIYSKGDTLLAGVNSTIYSSTDKGMTWRNADIDIKYGFTSFTFHSSGFLAACSDGIFKSSNLINWWRIRSGDGDLLKDNYGNLYLRQSHHIYRSIDGGTNWTQIYTRQGISAFGITNNWLICADGNKIYKKRINGIPSGREWIEISVPVPNIGKLVTDASGTRLLAIPVNDPIIGYSTDEGNTWSYWDMSIYFRYLQPLSGAWSGSTILLNFDHISYNRKVMRSSDNGLTWALSGEGLPIGASIGKIISSGTDFFTGSGSGVYKTTNGGYSWAKSSGGISELMMINIITGNDGVWFCSTPGSGVLKSTDSGNSWSEFNNGLNYIITWYLTKTSNDYFFVTAPDGIYRLKYNENNVWEKIASSDSHVFADQNNVLFYLESRLYRSTDLGDTWVEYLNFPDFAYHFNITQQGTVINSIDERIYRYANNGWHLVHTANDYITGFSNDPSGNIFATSLDGILKSTNDGITWTATTTGLTNKAINKIFTDGSGNYFCSAYWNWEIYPEFYYSNDGGESWSVITGNLFHNEVLDMLFIQNEIYLFTEKGFWKNIPIGPSPVIQNDLPVSITQNYPNPFNAATVIKYFVEKEGIVSIRIFDILGKEISIPLNEYRAPGEYDLTFDAAAYPSGIYFYEIRQNQHYSVRKMILMK